MILAIFKLWGLDSEKIEFTSFEHLFRSLDLETRKEGMDHPDFIITLEIPVCGLHRPAKWWCDAKQQFSPTNYLGQIMGLNGLKRKLVVGFGILCLLFHPNTKNVGITEFFPVFKLEEFWICETFWIWFLELNGRFSRYFLCFQNQKSPNFLRFLWLFHVFPIDNDVEK